MKLVDFSVNKRITISMLTLIIVVAGLISYHFLGLDLLPEIDYPIVTVVTTYRGASPEDVETLITKTMESAVSTVNRVRKVTSISQEGTSIIMVEFEWGTNLDFAAQDLRDRMGIYEAYLPEGAGTPLVMKFDLSMMPVLMLGFTSTMDDLELKELIEDAVAERLHRVDGVASAEVMSMKSREIQVRVRRAAIEARGLALDNIVRALRAENVNQPAGYIDRSHSEFVVRTVGEFKTIDDIRRTVVGLSREGNPIYLRDVASVEDTYADIRSIARIQGQNGVILMLSKRSGANTVKVANAVKKELAKIQADLPADIDSHTAWDQSRIIEMVAQSTVKNALWGGFLAVLLIWFFLRNWRPTLVIALAIPLSVVATFIAFYLAGYTLNLLTLGGLALGIGMLVDNSVVVIENIHRHLEEGEGRREGARIGASEVGMAITASTLTTIAVFFPMVFGGGISGKLARGLALSVSFSLFASLLVALTIVPMIASVLFERKRDRDVKGREMTSKGFYRLRKSYTRALRWALSHRKHVVITVAILFLASLGMVPLVGTEFMPAMDHNVLYLKVLLPVGTNLFETDRVVKLIENSMIDRPEVESVLSSSGVNEEDPDAGMGSGPTGPHEGFLMARMVRKKQRELSSAQLLEKLRGEMPKMDGIRIEAYDMGGMMTGGGQSPIEIKLFGRDLDVLKGIAERVIRQIADVPGLRDIDMSYKPGKPELQIQVDREAASRMGLMVGMVAGSVNTATLGTVATQFHGAGEEVNIRVKLDERDRASIDDLNNIPILTPAGRVLPLSQLANITESRGPVVINRENQTRRVSVTANIADRDLGSVVKDIQGRLKPITAQMPPGYFLEFAGQYEQMMDTFKTMLYAFLLAILLVYMVMASQFESLTHPLVIMFTVPLGFIGVMLGLVIGGQNVSLPALMGFIMLAGIAVNNGIVMVDYINQLRRRGMEVFEAIIQGATVRLRPVIITASTTILAMLPMVFTTSEGAEMRRPMALTLVGGLVATTILTLVFVPVMYSVLDRIASRTQKAVVGTLHGGEVDEATQEP